MEMRGADCGEVAGGAGDAGHGEGLRGAVALLGDDVEGPVLDLVVDAPHVLADDSQKKKIYTGKKCDR